MATSDRVSELFTAIQDSDLEQVKQLLEVPIPLEQRNSDGQTPLALASSIGKFEIINLLIAAGAKVYIEKEPLVFSPIISSVGLTDANDLSELIAQAIADAPDEVKNFYSDLLSVVDALSNNTLDEDEENSATTFLKQTGQ